MFATVHLVVPERARVIQVVMGLAPLARQESGGLA